MGGWGLAVYKGGVGFLGFEVTTWHRNFFFFLDARVLERWCTYMTKLALCRLETKYKLLILRQPLPSLPRLRAPFRHDALVSDAELETLQRRAVRDVR